MVLDARPSGTMPALAGCWLALGNALRVHASHSFPFLGKALISGIWASLLPLP